MQIYYNDSIQFHNTVTPISTLDATYVILVHITSFSSIVSCLFIVACFWIYPAIRTTSRKLLLYLSIANFIQSLGGILQAATYFKSLTLFDQRDLLCQASGIFVIYSRICCFLWTDVISFHLFLSVTLRSLTIGTKLLVFFHAFCWIMPVQIYGRAFFTLTYFSASAIVTLSAGLSDVIGYDLTYVLKYNQPTWCWISDRVENRKQWYMMTVEGWAFSSLIFCFLLFIVLAISVHRQKRHNKAMNSSDVIEDMAIQTVNKQLRYIPAIFVCLQFWGALYFALEQLATKINLHDSGTSWLLIMKGLTDNSQGFVNCILFCLTTNLIKSKIIRWMDLHCNFCWRRRQRTLDGHLSAPRIFRVRGKYEKKKPRLDELNLSDLHLDLPTAEQSSMMEDEVVFERD